MLFSSHGEVTDLPQFAQECLKHSLAIHQIEAKPQWVAGIFMPNGVCVHSLRRLTLR
jgi:hypothetical protein